MDAAVLTPTPVPSRFLAVSPEIAGCLADHPQSFLNFRAYARHVGFVLRRVKWWQVPAGIASFLLIVLVTGPVFNAAPYLAGLLVGPLVEEGARLVSLRTRAGIVCLGAGFAVFFPLAEAAVSFVDLAGHGMLIPGFIVLRVIAFFLHLYTHFVLAYRLSFFGRRHRALGSFVSAVLIHGGYNGATSVLVSIAIGG